MVTKSVISKPVVTRPVVTESVHITEWDTNCPHSLSTTKYPFTTENRNVLKQSLQSDQPVVVETLIHQQTPMISEGLISVQLIDNTDFLLNADPLMSETMSNINDCVRNKRTISQVLFEIQYYFLLFQQNGESNNTCALNESDFDWCNQFFTTADNSGVRKFNTIQL